MPVHNGPPQNPIALDIAIIGGGVAGAYTAYRLTQTDLQSSPILRDLLQKSGKDHLTIGVFEYNGHVGGRLWSQPFANPTLHADLGGHGFNILQQNVYGLCTQELKLPYRPCLGYNSQQLQYIRRHRYHYTEYVPEPPKRTPRYYPDTVPFFLTDSEQWQSPDQLVMRFLCEHIAQVSDYLTPVEAALRQQRLPEAFLAMQALTAFLREAQFDNTPLWGHGLWNVLQERLSSEAYALLLQSDFAYSDFRNWNLYDAVWNTLFMSFSFLYADAPFWELSGGFQTLPQTLIDKFLQHPGTDVYVNSQLYRFRGRPSEAGAPMTFEIGKPVGRVVSHQGTPVQARYVVLALPKRGLQLLDQHSFFFGPQTFRDALECVDPTPAVKIVFRYDTAWWQSLGITGGYSTTDLPLRGCYYAATDPTTGHAVLTASLSDDVMSAFWAGYLRPPSPAISMLTVPPDMLPLVTEDLKRTIRQQLTAIHGGEVPEAQEAFMQDWRREPFGGGWHNWYPQHKSWEIMRRVRKPVADAGIFVCGEAYSAQQGWVEGVLNTAEKVLEEHFAVPRPGWVLLEYDFGP